MFVEAFTTLHHVPVDAKGSAGRAISGMELQNRKLHLKRYVEGYTLSVRCTAPRMIHCTKLWFVDVPAQAKRMLRSLKITAGTLRLVVLNLTRSYQTLD